jgi:hypothetical protein
MNYSIYDKLYSINEEASNIDHKTGKSIEGVEITIDTYSKKSDDYINEQLSHLKEDYDTAKKNFISKLKDTFIPWLKSEEINEKNYKKHIKLYEIQYSYKHIIEKYSPTGKDGYFGEFEFCFNGVSDIGKHDCQAAALVLTIQNNKVVKAHCYDI